jgi:tetratricopeptide (TPR) repeat protein
MGVGQKNDQDECCRPWGRTHLKGQLGANRMPTARKWIDEGHGFEKAGNLDRALRCYGQALTEASDGRLRSEVLRRTSHVLRTSCQWQDALAAARASAREAEEVGDRELLAEACNAEAAVFQSQGDFEQAVPLYRRMLQLAPTGRIHGIARLNLASISAVEGDLDAARQEFRAAFECFEEAHYEWGMAFALNNLGRLMLDADDPTRAAAELEKAIELAKRLNDLELLAIAKLNRAEAMLQLGQPDNAVEQASAALGHFCTEKNDWRRIDALRLLGDISVSRNEYDTARNFFTAGLQLAKKVGARVEQERLEARLRSSEA